MTHRRIGIVNADFNGHRWSCMACGSKGSWLRSPARAVHAGMFHKCRGPLLKTAPHGRIEGGAYLDIDSAEVVFDA